MTMRLKGEQRGKPLPVERLVATALYVLSLGLMAKCLLPEPAETPPRRADRILQCVDPKPDQSQPETSQMMCVPPDDPDALGSSDETPELIVWHGEVLTSDVDGVDIDRWDLEDGLCEENPEEEQRTRWQCPAVPDSLSSIVMLPATPRPGEPLRVVAVSRRQKVGLELKVLNQIGAAVKPDRAEAWGYVPRAHSVRFRKPEPGEYRAVLLRAQGTEALACLDFTIPPETAKAQRPLPGPPTTGIWHVKRNWDPRMEDLFSAFVARLFHVRRGQKAGWRPMHQTTRDPYRNILYGSLGMDEDNPRSEITVKLEPDCADAPYHLRAYFAWKMGLPFKFNRCTRGNSVTGPKCSPSRDMLTRKYDRIRHPVRRFNAFVRTYVSWAVHSGNGRTLPEYDTSDFYPVRLDRESLRPGTVFVDSGGHLIMITQWESQTGSAMGALYGMDAHPDRTVTHKRFSPGTFVFNHRVRTDGFKAFRPVALRKGKVEFLSNEEIAKSGFMPYSTEQAHVTTGPRFYTTVSKILNPRPLDPGEVLKSKVEVLFAATLERVEAVQLGVEYMARRRWSVVSMPKGARIFETTGPWETYSTPARDLRYFLALDDVMKFPATAVRNLELYKVKPGQSRKRLRRKLAALRDRLLGKKRFRYTRSDGSHWTLTLKKLADRQKELEMSYNPNDCPEIRWAAPKGSYERRPCRQKAPRNQWYKMRKVRHWFAWRYRPNQK